MSNKYHFYVVLGVKLLFGWPPWLRLQLVARCLIRG